jgi:ribosome-binding protein aMBF1 (putative translation factor)
MIKNERQYRITRAQAERFARELAKLAEAPAEAEGVDPIIRKAMEDAARSQLATLRRELKEYEALRARTGNERAFQVNSFDELPRALVQARIAAGLSQKELAQRLGLKEQQIQRYEATDYASASLRRVRAVIEALGEDVIDVRVSVTPTGG